MILKTEIKEGDHFIINHIDGIKSIMHERKNNSSHDYLGITYKNDDKQLFILSEYIGDKSTTEGNRYKDLFSNVYLLNDEGKTIERLF